MHCDPNARTKTLSAKAFSLSTQRSDPGAMSDVILETHSLTNEFKGFTAVSDVNLAVRRGSIHALIGPNGAGKTTCFNLLTKFLTPTSGTIRFNGHDITREQPAQIARRGVIPARAWRPLRGERSGNLLRKAYRGCAVSEQKRQRRGVDARVRIALQLVCGQVFAPRTLTQPHRGGAVRRAMEGILP